MNEMTSPIHPAILRYSAGELSAPEAAELMGPDSTVHDVIQVVRRAGLPVPRLRPREEELAQLALARQVLAESSAG